MANKKVTAVLIESFADSTDIGKKGLDKIELFNYRTTDSSYVVISFYSKTNNTWKLKSEFNFEKDVVSSIEPHVSDFNNDGFKDITYISATAARGANELRKLFLYNRKKDDLIYIKNSEQYRNMLYNKQLNCIDAFLVYGGCSTVFLKISGDSLKEFANVELFDGLTVTTYNKHGKEKVVFKDTLNKDKDVRYINYSPLEAYKDQ